MKYVAFDVGNVLFKVDFTPFINKLSRSLNITVSEATYFLNRSHKLHDLGLTVMHDELLDHLKIKSSVLRDDLVLEWNHSIHPADWMIDRMDKFCTKNDLQVILLSNVGLEHAVRMKESFKPYPSFDNAIQHFSCDVGARKPTMLYYQSFLQSYPECKGCPYIDDLEENLKMGARFGFQTMKFSIDDVSGKNYQEDTFEVTIQNLEKFILQ
jgi:FMN phosphatase YigB (HAD superfamily)